MLASLVIGGMLLLAIVAASGWVPGFRDVLVPAVMVVVLAFQAGALILARRPGGRTAAASR